MRRGERPARGRRQENRPEENFFLVQGKEKRALRNAERQDGVLTRYSVIFPLKKHGPLQ